MNKELVLRALKRFLRVWVASFVILLPSIPQDFTDINPYLGKVLVAAGIGVIMALDKILRDYNSSK